jgi:hypothetical protein
VDVLYLEVTVGKITIRFVGLAVHLDRKDAPGLDVEHRVVLLATDTDVLFERSINPHHPELHFPQEARLALNEVSLSIPNAKGPDFHKEDTFGKVPRITPEGSTPLPLAESVAYHGAKPATAYFDTDHGSLSACQTAGGAIATKLEIETEDAPRLTMASFQPGVQAEHYQFNSDDVVLTIANMALEGKDDDFDFFLSYRILQGLPMAPHIPGKQDVPSCDHPIGDDLGPACSNSSYP